MSEVNVYSLKTGNPVTALKTNTLSVSNLTYRIQNDYGIDIEKGASTEKLLELHFQLDTLSKSLSIKPNKIGMVQMKAALHNNKWQIVDIDNLNKEITSDGFYKTWYSQFEKQTIATLGSSYDTMKAQTELLQELLKIEQHIKIDECNAQSLVDFVEYYVTSYNDKERNESVIGNMLLSVVNTMVNTGNKLTAVII